MGDISTTADPSSKEGLEMKTPAKPDVKKTDKLPLLSAISTEDLTRRSWTINIKAWLNDISLRTFILLSLFAMSGWLLFLGIAAEAPFMVNVLPEGLAIPGYYTIISQVGNLSPLLFLGLNWLFPGRIYDWAVIYTLMCLSFLSCFLTGFLWDYIVVIGGEDHSLPFFILTAITSLAYAASTLVYPAYIATFKPQYMTCMYVGVGFAGLAIGGLILIQGDPGRSPCWNTTVITDSVTGQMYNLTILEPGENIIPTFSVDTFCFVLCGLLVISAIAFTVVHRANFTQVEKVVQHARGLGNSMFSNDFGHQLFQDEVSSGDFTEDNKHVRNGSIQCSDLPTHDTNNTNNNTQSTDTPLKPPGGSTKVKDHEIVILLALQVIGSAIVLSLQHTLAPYFTRPYGGKSYTYVAGLTNAAMPVGCLITLILPAMPVLAIYFFYVIGISLFGGLMFLAGQGDTAPLAGTVAGTWMVVSRYS